MVGDDPRLSRVDESSQSGTSFPESATSFEDVIMHNAAHILREWNVELESERLQRCDIRNILCENVRALLTREGTKARDFLDVYLTWKRFGIRPEDEEECIVGKIDFSLKYPDAALASRLPSEMTWLIAEIGMVLNKLEDLMNVLLMIWVDLASRFLGLLRAGTLRAQLQLLNSLHEFC
jgi:hypothetical protein